MSEQANTQQQNSAPSTTMAESTPAIISGESQQSQVVESGEQSLPSTATPEQSSDNTQPASTQKVDTKAIHENFKAVLRGEQPSQIKKVEKEKAGDGSPEGSGNEEVQTETENVEESEGRTQPGKKLDSRVFDGLDDEEVKVFKQMSNLSYNKVYKPYLEAKKLKETLAQKDQEIEKYKATQGKETAKVFYDHEEGYKLLPEYHKMEAEYDQASTEARIRQQQLAKVEDGQEWQEITRDKDGNYVYTGEMLPPDGNAKAFLHQAISKLSVIQHDAMNKAIQFQKSYKDRYTGAASAVEQVLLQHAPEFKDQSYAGWEVAKKLINTVPEFANHPMTKVAGILFAKLHQWQEQAKAEAKAKELKNVVAKDKRNGGPSVGGMQVVGKAPEQPRFKLDDFKRRIDMGI